MGGRQVTYKLSTDTRYLVLHLAFVYRHMGMGVGRHDCRSFWYMEVAIMSMLTIAPPKPTVWIPPRLPKEYICPVFELPQGGRVVRPLSGDDLQKAFNEARFGDIIVLASGLTYEGPFVVPPAASGSGAWVYVVSDNLTDRPEHTRVAGAALDDMPKLTTYDAADTTLTIRKGTSRYRFSGVEIASDYDVRTSTQYGIVKIGQGGTGRASEIVFDRCYIHGTATGNTRDGLLIYAVDKCGITENHISECHATGSVGYGIHLAYAPSQVTIENNRIEAAGINVFVGDNTSTSDATDVVLRGNNVYKPHEWKVGHADYVGVNWSVRAMLELRGAERVLVESNTFEQNWLESADGRMVILANPYDGDVQHVTFRRNILRENRGYSVISATTGTGTGEWGELLIEDNLAVDVQKYSGGYASYTFSIAGGTGRVTGDYACRNNTVVTTTLSGTTSLLGIISAETDADALPLVRFYNNIGTSGTYGVYAGGTTQSHLEAYTVEHYFDSNALIDGTSSYHTPDDGDDWTDFWYPDNNADVGFVSCSFEYVPADYALRSGTTYASGSAKSGTDGEDLGCNISALSACPSLIGSVVGKTTTINAAWLSANGPAPYILTGNCTTYRLATNVSTDGTAFVFGAAGLVLDLNGYTVTYGNASPITVANGGFESGTGTSVPNWDLSNAASAAIAANNVYAWGSQILKFTDISSTEYIVSDDISIPTAGRSYTATICAKGPSTCQVVLSIHDATDDSQLASVTFTGNDLNRGGSAVKSFTASNTNDVYLKVTVTPSGTQTVWLDYASLTHSKDYGVVMTDATYGDYLPSGLSSTATNAMRNYANGAVTGPGSILQGQSRSYHGWAVYANEQPAGGVYLDNITSSQNGIDAGFYYGQNSRGAITITNCTITSTVDKCTNRSNKGFVILCSGEVSKQCTLSNNSMSGHPKMGIVVSYDGGHVINGNTINSNSRVTNAYGIVVHAVDGCDITNNTIATTDSGRGILLEADGEYEHMTNINVHGNTISVMETPNPEFWYTQLECTGIRMRTYSAWRLTNIDIYNNDITVTNGSGYTQGAIPIRLTAVNSGAVDDWGITIRNNTLKAIVNSTSSSYWARSIDLASPQAGVNTRITYNVLESNHVSIGLGSNDGASAYDTWFVSNECKKSTSGAARTYQSVNAGYGGGTIDGIYLIDQTYCGGAMDTIVHDGTGNHTINVGWLLTVKCENVGGSPISGASVSVEDKDSDPVADGTSNASGLVSELEITETVVTYNGSVQSTDDRNDHTVKVTAAGYSNYSDTETVDASKTHTAVMT